VDFDPGLEKEGRLLDEDSNISLIEDINSALTYDFFIRAHFLCIGNGAFLVCEWV
jgi:hypothetical protein